MPVGPSAALPAEPVSIEGAAFKGALGAPVVVIEYSDFQCPFCGTFARDTLPGISKAYIDPGKVKIAFRHLPLERIHPFALKAAAAAQCAGRQGRFWDMHDLLFKDQHRLESESLQRRAREIGLEERTFGLCLSDEVENANIRTGIEAARGMGITSTPTFLFGRTIADGRVQVLKRASGALSLSALGEILRELTKNAN